MLEKTKKNLSLLMLVSIIGANVVMAAPNYQYNQSQQYSQQYAPQYQNNYYPAQPQYSKNQTLKGRVVNVPAGVTMAAVVSTPISSEFLMIGQPVSVTLGSDFYYNSSLIAPAGSTVSGQ